MDFHFKGEDKSSIYFDKDFLALSTLEDFYLDFQSGLAKLLSFSCRFLPMLVNFFGYLGHFAKTC